MFGIAALILVGIGVALAVAPVRVPRIGDDVAYHCTPITAGVDDDPTLECVSHVSGRLREAILAGIAAGACGVIASEINRTRRQ